MGDMTMTKPVQMQHEWTPAHLATAVALWQRLIEAPGTHVAERYAYGYATLEEKELTVEWVTALVLSGGEPVAFPSYDGNGSVGEYPSVEVTLVDYSDYGGSDCDAANVRSLADVPGVTTSTDGPHGEGSATMTLGELGTPFHEGLPTALDRLRHVVEMMEGLASYPLLDEETHSEYIQELAEAAWDQWLSSDVRSEVIDALDAAGLDGWEVFDAADDDAIRQAFYSYSHTSGEGWRAEGATSVVHTYGDEAVKHVLRLVFSQPIVVECECDECYLANAGRHDPDCKHEH